MGRSARPRVACLGAGAWGRNIVRNLSELEALAEVCARVPAEPARSFREAVNSLWLCQVGIHAENINMAMSPGRLDQVLYPFFAHDLENGLLTIEEAPCLHLGSESLRVPPRLADAATVHHCAAALSDKTSRAMLGEAFERYEWYFSELQGHRAPIRLIRRPLEVFSLMFERIYD